MEINETALAAAKAHARTKAGNQPAIMGEMFAEIAENAIRFYFATLLAAREVRS